MKIILMESMANLGSLGDLVKVKNGYGRNFLIPQGKAKRATEANLKLFEVRRAELERLQAERMSSAHGLAAKIEGLHIKFERKSSQEGHLFGSVTSTDILESLVSQDILIERSWIRMPNGPLKSVGDFSVEIILQADVRATITVSVTTLA